MHDGDDVNIDDYPKSHRRLWIGVGVCLGVFSVVYGASNAVQGNAYLSTPSYYILERMPGGMHVNGVVLLLIGMWMMVECRMPERTKRHPALRTFMGYCTLVVVSMLGSWIITGDVRFGSPWAFIAFAGIACAMILYPPPLTKGRRCA